MSISAQDLETAERASAAFRLQSVNGFLNDPNFDSGSIFGIPKSQEKTRAQEIFQVREAFSQKLHGADEMHQKMSDIKKQLKNIDRRLWVLEKILDLLEGSEKLEKKIAVLSQERKSLEQELKNINPEMAKVEGISTRQAAFEIYGHQIFSQVRMETSTPDAENGKKIIDLKAIPLSLRAYLSVPENHAVFETVYNAWAKSKPEIDDYGQEQGPKTLKPLELIFRMEREKMRDIPAIQNPLSVAALTALFVHNDIVRILNGAESEGSIDAQANAAIARWVSAKKLTKNPNVLRGANGLLRKEKMQVGKFDQVFSADDMMAVLAKPTKEGNPTGLELAGILDDTLAKIIKQLDDPFDIEDAVLLRRANEYGVIAHVLNEKMKGGINPETVIETVRAEVGKIMSDTGVEMAKRKAKVAKEKKEAHEKEKKAKRDKWIHRALNAVSFGLWHKTGLWKMLTLVGLFTPPGGGQGHGNDGGGNGGHE